MPSGYGAEASPVQESVRILRRRKLPAILTVLVIVGATLISSLLEKPLYASTARVIRETGANPSLFQQSNGSYIDPQRILLTEVAIIESEPVRQAAQAELGFPGVARAKPFQQTDIIEIIATDGKPERADAIANAYAKAYIERHRKQAVEDVLSGTTELQATVSDLQRQIEAASGPTRDALLQQQALFKTKLDQLRIDAKLQTGGAQIVSAALPSREPASPRTVHNVVIAGVLAVLLGVGLAFLAEHLDDSIRSKEDLERAAPSTTVLSLIPTVRTWKDRHAPMVVSVKDPTSPAAEAYRTLRTAIQFGALDRPLQSLQITSATAQEGKTTTLANLAVALAGAGQEVVVVSTDLRRPRVHEFFGVSNEVGFTSVLLGQVSLEEALISVEGVPRLRILASGPLPPNASELLQTQRAADVLQAITDTGRFLLIDAPPVLPVTDAAILSRRVQGTILVFAAGQTSRREVGRAIELLRVVDAPIIGTVLNRAPYEAAYGYADYRYAADPTRMSSNGQGAKKRGGRRKRREKTV